MLTVISGRIIPRQCSTSHRQTLCSVYESDGGIFVAALKALMSGESGTMVMQIGSFKGAGDDKDGDGRVGCCWARGDPASLAFVG